MPSVYKVNDGENIFDAALATYGTLELVYKIVLDNPQLESIDTDLPSLPGLSLVYDDTVLLPEVQGELKIQLPPDKNEYVIQEGQSLFDLALMVYGNVEKVFQIVQDNIEDIPSINQSVLAGISMNFDSLLNDNLVLTKYLVKNGLTINTSDPKVNPGSGFSIGFRTESFY
jgi:uncharacterized ubiquitin-like protein YukD